MEDKLRNYLIDRAVETHIRLYYPRASSHRYGYGINGSFERLIDEIKYEHIKEIARNFPELDLEDMGERISLRIREKTTINF
ncbi:MULTISPECIES: hypothetical protein [unclassified Virgibacillus]|uniref:hypothetical protein n=1 Tax=unclassified Virgibacillus TaxID=2620237 RepID=UPI00090967A8|nr:MULTISPECIES: hypothetical protein [unclassified Virgibacillus]API92677.1 hypothetical protein BKP57_13205 [Virgibacillus sp. 6R]MBS7428171.1 hypothetical protein [Virgibacillus sp. 19R1-5]